MNPGPYAAVKNFEAALCEYTGAPYAVTVNSCTAALMLAVAWHIQRAQIAKWGPAGVGMGLAPDVEIPRRTYVSVPQSIIHAGGRPVFRDEDWLGCYRLRPLLVWDSARWFTKGMYSGNGPDEFGPQAFANWGPGQMACVSFHASKTLGHSQGGAILHDNPEADAWLRRARFDGRTEGVAPKADTFTQLGHHCYMSADVAAALHLKLLSLPRHNAPLPNDDYPDLSALPIFRGDPSVNHKNHGNNQPAKPTFSGEDRRDPLTINYGFTKDAAIIIFSQRVDQIQMTLEQVDGMIKALQEARDGHAALAKGDPPPAGSRSVAAGSQSPS